MSVDVAGKKRRILYVSDPIISTYPEYGNLFSLLDLTNPSVVEWVISNFIHIRAHNNVGGTCFNGFTSFKDIWTLQKTCPFLHYYSYPYEMTTGKCYKSLRKLIVDSVNKGFYIFVYLNRSYITNKEATASIDHQTLIYGYDLRKKVVLVSDNLNNGKYKRTEYKIEDVEKAYANLEENRLSEILLFKKSDSCAYKFDVEFLKRELELYLKPECINIPETVAVNLEVVQFRIDNLEPDVRPFCIFYEHKIIMELRLKYLMEKGYLEYDAHLVKKLSLLKERYLVIRNKVVKLNFDDSRNLIDSIKKDLEDAIQEEFCFMKELAERLKV